MAMYKTVTFITESEWKENGWAEEAESLIYLYPDGFISNVYVKVDDDYWKRKEEEDRLKITSM